MTDSEVILQWLTTVHWHPSSPDIDWEDYEDEDLDDEIEEEEEEEVFHLPGQHDQKAHGKGGGRLESGGGDGEIADKFGVKWDVAHTVRTDGEGNIRHNYDIIPKEAHRGVTAGGVTLSRDSSMIMSVGIHPEYRRRGLAIALYRHIEKHLGYRLKENWAQTSEGKALWDAFVKTRGEKFHLSGQHDQKVHGKLGASQGSWRTPNKIKQLGDLVKELNYGFYGLVRGDDKATMLMKLAHLKFAYGGAVFIADTSEPGLENYIQEIDKLEGRYIVLIGWNEDDQKKALAWWDAAESENYELSRELNRYEQKVDFEHLTDQLDTLEHQTRTRLIELLTESKSAMLLFIDRNWDSIGKISQDLRLKGMNDIQETIGEFLRQAYQIGWDSVGREMQAPISMDSMFTPKEALAYLKQKKFWVSGLLKDSVTKEIQAIIFNAIKSGENPRETQQKIADAFEPYIGNESVLRDQKQIEPYRIETILRTNATDALNHGRLVRARQIPELLQGMQYSAIIDTRTTEICRHLDGKVFKMDDPMLDSLTPPNHFSCRSVLVPITIAEKVNEEEYINSEVIGKARDLMDPGFGGSTSKS